MAVLSSAYAELAVTTNFSFLRGASRPEELVAQAKALGIAGLGIADRNSVAGVVRAHVAGKTMGFPIAPGARLVFADGTPDILAYPRDRAAWGRLTRLLSLGKRRAEKGDCILELLDLFEFIEGQNLIVMPPPKIDARALESLLRRLKEKASKPSVWLAAAMTYRGDDARRLARLAEIAEAALVPLIAVNDVLYHTFERRELQDVLTCVREKTTIEAAGRRLEANAERHLKSPAEMARLFRGHPKAVEQTEAFFERCRFSLEELRGTEYPEETRKDFATPHDALVAYAEEGARRRFPEGMTPKLRHALDEELRLVGKLGYAPFFLTVHDIVSYARRPGVNILCQGRGSAANSMICYCLGITDVDPRHVDLLFERFVSEERKEPPDIDVDFEHERREEIIQYIYRTYTRERAGLAATVICYRGRSAIRDVGKVLGLSDDTIGVMSGSMWGWSREGVSDAHARRAGLDPSDRRLAQALRLSRELIGFPRHLSQHVGGFVMTRNRLDEVVPIENAAMEERTVIEWEKNDLEALGLLKVDVLALGMLSCLRRAFDLLRDHYGETRDLAMQDEDKRTYAMIQRADTLGVFQIESRAQMSMLPRLKPKEFYDLVIEVAIVRPGPIQGDMVHPYLRRREGLEEVKYPARACAEPGAPNELEEILRKTLGVPLFQEQAMRIAIVAAGFEPGEADRLRRAMATFKRVGTIRDYQKKFIDGMCGRGYPQDFAERCFSQIEGFGEYGFPESHAASFANLVYASSWIKCHYPDVFAAALLNSQPMGFYAPAQIVRDAQEHGVEVRPADINLSDWDCTLEEGTPATGRIHRRHAGMEGDIRSNRAIRLGLRQIAGISDKVGARIMEARGAGFDSVRDFWLRTGLERETIEKLAAADAFRSIGLDRRNALWAIRALRRAGDKDDLPLFAHARSVELEPGASLPVMPLGQHVVEDYKSLRLSLKAHPVSFLRPELAARGIVRCEQLAELPPDRWVTVAGIVLVRQRPGSSKGVIFTTLEDETGIANTICWPRVFETYRPIVMGARFVAVTGRLQRQSGVIHVVAHHLEDLTPMLMRLVAAGPSAEAPVHGEAGGRAGSGGYPPADHERRRARQRLLGLMPREAEEAMPRGRNFH